VLPGAAGRLGSWLNLWSGDRIAAQAIFATLICGYFYFYSTRVDYYSYYFMLIMPWMGLMTATMALDVARYIRDHGRPPAQPEARQPRAERRRRERAAGRNVATTPWRIWPLLVCVAVVLAVMLYRRGIGGDRQADMGEEASHYAWRDSRYLPSFMNRMVRALFWSPRSDPVHLPNAITYYLQHETMSAPTVDQFVQAVRRQCRPGERIFGEYSLGPFAAALGPCVLAANLADTNPHRFKVHESTPEDWIRALEADHLSIAIVVPGSTMMREPALHKYFSTTFPRVVETWNDPYVGHVELRRRAE